MHASIQAQRAYGDRTAPVRTDRSMEYDVFARITERMQASSRRGRPGFKDLVEALYENRRLWTRVASAVSDDDNRLPLDLRARLLYLSEFTLDFTGKVMRGEEQADALIEVNVAVMRGLAGQPGAGR